MKQFIYVSILLILASACARIEETEFNDMSRGEMVKMQLKASIESDVPETRTYLDGEPVASVRNTYWLPEDTIAVISSNTVARFANTCAEMASIAVFDGNIEYADQYYALYPYCAYPDPESAGGHSFEDGVLGLVIPEVQKYESNTFATDIVPMVSEFSPGDILDFKNVCGGLVFKLTGTDKITSGTFVAYDDTGAEARIGGVFFVDMDSEQYSMTPSMDAASSIEINCGNGVQLNSGVQTAFHLLLPPATYNGFRMTFTSETGKIMVIESSKQLNIRRSNITYVASLPFENNIQYVDLSLAGTSNCYIVPRAGAYSFDATTIGNGSYGIIERVGFHTGNPTILPESVEVIWQDREDVLTKVGLNDGRVSFMATGVEGNALVAVKDDSGNIIWSWHIWVTDQPKEQLYVNSTGSYTVLDRNIGATRADRGSGDEWKESMGTVYFWGRKDPFYSPDAYELGRRALTIEESIKYPNVSHSSSSSGPWVEPENHYLWSDSQKTIYDPCPVGYRVATSNIWADFTTTRATTYRIEEYNISGGFDFGFNFYINESKTETSWYPLTHKIDWPGRYSAVGTESLCWSSDFKENVRKVCFRYYYKSDRDTEVTMGYSTTEARNYSSNAYPVRCIKDEGYVNESYPQFADVFVEVTTSSARVEAPIISSGASDVIEKGIIWGIKPDLSDGVRMKCGEGSDKIIGEITGLMSSSKYYVKAYAINSHGESFTELQSFTTLSSEGNVNLSANGTSNCYIVTDTDAEYVFDCGVKGNSNESIGVPAELDVLWETVGCSQTATKGSLISSVSLQGCNAVLKFASGVKEGNALIVAKDAMGIVLWSWHIWVTDSPKEQVYKNNEGSFYVLDRNIGATRPDKGSGEEWKDSRGLVYFWGRKDPFWYGCYGHGESSMTIEYSIQNPNIRHKTGNWNSSITSWLGDYKHDPTLWQQKKKTIYDPCPVGYKVAENLIWSGFTSTGQSTENISELNVKGSYDNGWEFYIDNSKTETAWYPAIYGMAWHSGHEEYTDKGYVWSSTSSNGPEKYSLFYTESKVQLNERNTSDGWGYPVRCMREK